MKLFVSCGTKTIKRHKIKKNTHHKFPGPSPRWCVTTLLVLQDCQKPGDIPFTIPEG